ncbi:MAG: hypothetical protein IJ079_00705 [Lachnospiraceae bacterium]|nr:hypothetical protein [Lachnospiraceae bacterium]
MDKQNGLRIPRKLQRIVSMLTAMLMVISTLATDGGMVLVNAATSVNITFEVNQTGALDSLPNETEISYVLTKKADDSVVVQDTTTVASQSITANLDDDTDYVLELRIVKDGKTYLSRTVINYTNGSSYDAGSITLEKVETYTLNVEGLPAGTKVQYKTDTDEYADYDGQELYCNTEYDLRYIIATGDQNSKVIKSVNNATSGIAPDQLSWSTTIAADSVVDETVQLFSFVISDVFTLNVTGLLSSTNVQYRTGTNEYENYTDQKLYCDTVYDLKYEIEASANTVIREVNNSTDGIAPNQLSWTGTIDANTVSAGTPVDYEFDIPASGVYSLNITGLPEGTYLQYKTGANTYENYTGQKLYCDTVYDLKYEIEASANTVIREVNNSTDGIAPNQLSWTRTIDANTVSAGTPVDYEFDIADVYSLNITGLLDGTKVKYQKAGANPDAYANYDGQKLYCDTAYDLKYEIDASTNKAIRGVNDSTDEISSDQLSWTGTIAGNTISAGIPVVYTFVISDVFTLNVTGLPEGTYLQYKTGANAYENYTSQKLYCDTGYDLKYENADRIIYQVNDSEDGINISSVTEAYHSWVSTIAANSITAGLSMNYSFAVINVGDVSTSPSTNDNDNKIYPLIDGYQLNYPVECTISNKLDDIKGHLEWVITDPSADLPADIAYDNSNKVYILRVKRDENHDGQTVKVTLRYTGQSTGAQPIDLVYQTFTICEPELEYGKNKDFAIIYPNNNEAKAVTVNGSTYYVNSHGGNLWVYKNNDKYDSYSINEGDYNAIADSGTNAYELTNENRIVRLRMQKTASVVSALKEVEIAIDADAPEITDVDVDDNPYSDASSDYNYTEQKNVSFKVADTLSGICKVYYSNERLEVTDGSFTIDEAKSNLLDSTTGTYSFTADPGDNTELASKKYYIYAVDNVANWTVIEITVYKLDKKTPVVSVKNSSSVVNKDSKYYISAVDTLVETVTITDLSFDYESFEAHLTENNPSVDFEKTVTASKYVYKIKLKADAEDGSYNLPLFIQDLVTPNPHTTEAKNAIESIILDTSSPNIDKEEIKVIDQGAYLGTEEKPAATYYDVANNNGFVNKMNVSFTITDANLDENSVKVIINDGTKDEPEITPTISKQTDGKTYKCSFSIEKGYYGAHFTIYAKDFAENKETELKSGTFILDKSQAEISNVKIAKEDGSDEVALDNSKTLYFKSDKYLIFTVTEDHFAIDQLTIKVNDTEYAGLGTTSNGDQENEILVKVPLKDIITTYDGEMDYAIQIIYDDIPYGNELRDAKTDVYTIRVDDTAPSLTGTIRQSGKAQKAILDLALTEANPKDAEVLEEIAITAIDVNGDDISSTISSTVGLEGNTQASGASALGDALKDVTNWSAKVENGKTVYLTTVEISTDGIYTFAASSTDKSENKGNTYATGEFVVDHTVPTIDSIEITEAKNFLDYKYFSGSTINVKVTVSDATSGINKDSITLSTKDVNGAEKTYGGTVVEADSAIAEKTGRYPKVVVTIPIPKDEADFKGQLVTVHVEDMVANVTESESYGVIVETNEMHLATSALDITPSEYNKNDFYNKDVTLNMSAEDTYSGLRLVNYTLNGTKTNALDNTGSTAAIQTSKWSDAVVLAATAENEGNEIKVGLDIEDNAGNTSSIEKTYKIDITKPVVTVTYDLNTPSNEKYYNQTRTATVSINELNLDTAAATGDVQLIVTRNGSPVAVTNNFSRSGNISTMTYPFAEDGDYTFTVIAEDMAGNKADYTQVDEFTIDQTLPTISIAYDNNNASNGNYYGEGRTATVTVEEHNFDPNGVAMTITATNDGAAATVPSISSFSSNGDIHTASIQFNDDADYTITGTVTDLASNESQALSQEEFTVDLIAPEVTISAVEEGASYNGTIAPRVTVTDTNFDENGVTIEVNGGKNGVNHDVSYNGAAITNGEEYTYVDFAKKDSNDDYYTLTATATDKAGHQTTQFTTFRVNRFGSVYDLNTYTQNAVDNFYTNADEDFVIIETNVDELESVDIFYSKDGEIVDLTEGIDYETEMKENTSNWREYTYTIDSDRITEEGVYVFSVYSEDAAGNKTDNKSKGKDIEFCIDRTAPSVVITGVADGEVYEQESVTATIDIYDNIYLASVEVYLNDEKTEYSSEDIVDGKIEVVIPESNRDQTLRVRGIDGAGNVYDTDDNGEIRFTVSSNVIATTLARVSNSRWIWFAIGGAVLLLAGGFIFFLLKRRSQNQ